MGRHPATRRNAKVLVSYYGVVGANTQYHVARYGSEGWGFESLRAR